MVVLALLAGPLTVVRGQEGIDYYQLLLLDRAAFRAPPLALLPLDEAAPGAQQIVYGDRYGIVRVIEFDQRGLREIWRSRVLEGGAVLEVLVEDLEGDGPVEIIVRTQGGRLYVFDDRYNPKWESLPEDYQQVTAMVIANMDDDLAFELVVLSGTGLIDYIDGRQFNQEFRTTQSYRGTDMAVGNVDNDFDLEIVLNTGWVIDSRRGEPDWQTESFGQFVELIDIDADGLQEVIGHTPNQPMRIFDVDQQQEKPLQ